MSYYSRTIIFPKQHATEVHHLSFIQGFSIDNLGALDYFLNLIFLFLLIPPQCYISTSVFTERLLQNRAFNRPYSKILLVLIDAPKMVWVVLKEIPKYYQPKIQKSRLGSRLSALENNEKRNTHSKKRSIKNMIHASCRHLNFVGIVTVKEQNKFE